MSGKLEQEEGKSPLVKALGESIKGKIVDKGKKKKNHQLNYDEIIFSNLQT